MNNSKDKDLIKYLAAAGLLGLSYFVLHFLSKKKKSATNPLDLAKTQKILQQIKYQILTTCISSVDAFKSKPKAPVSQKDLQIYFRTEMSKIYQMREQTILKKYIVSKDEYSASLETHKKDQKIRNGTNEIFDMLEKTIKGIVPDLTVPGQAKRVLSEKQISKVYYELCELIAIKVWQKLDQSKRNNPGFNSKDNVHFSSAIRELSIYDIKVQYLQKKGFQKRWGCPNEVFYKVMESVKQSNKEFKTQITAIEKAYEYAIQRITNEPDHLDAQRVKFLFNEKLHQKNPIVNIPPQPKPANPVQTFAAPKSISKPVPAKKDDDEFDLDKLMMQELMNRSQEQPKVEKPAVVKQQTKVQPKVQQKIEPFQAKVEQAPIADIKEEKPVEKNQQKIEHPVADAHSVEEVPPVTSVHPVEHNLPVEVVASQPIEVLAENPVDIAEAPVEQAPQKQKEVPVEIAQAHHEPEVKVEVVPEVHAEAPSEVKEAEGQQHINLENQAEKIEENVPQVVAPEVHEAAEIQQKKQE